jgi:hypothetical protein
MRLIKFDVFWRCISSQYLTLTDIAIFDTAIYNLGIRITLGLPLANIESTECHNTEFKTITVYESNLFLNQNHIITITNESMMLWCNRKRIRLSNINIGNVSILFIPISDYDAFNYVKILSFHNYFQRDLVSGDFLSRFHSLAEVYFNVIDVNILNNLILLVKSNQSRLSNPVYLNKFQSDGYEMISDELIMEFIESTPMMESFEMVYFKLSKDC